MFADICAALQGEALSTWKRIAVTSQDREQSVSWFNRVTGVPVCGLRNRRELAGPACKCVQQSRNGDIRAGSQVIAAEKGPQAFHELALSFIEDEPGLSDSAREAEKSITSLNPVVVVVRAYRRNSQLSDVLRCGCAGWAAHSFKAGWLRGSRLCLSVCLLCCLDHRCFSPAFVCLPIVMGAY